MGTGWSIKRPGKQKEIEFTAPDLKTASQPGIQWRPDDATPEEAKKWNEEEGGWWAKYSLHTIAIATGVQITMISFMLLTFHLLDLTFGK